MGSDGTRLFVAEQNGNRVLIFNTIPTASGAAADLVVGQPNLTTSGAVCTASGLGKPVDVIAVGGKLIVADSTQHRVLIYNSIPTANGAAADLVLGQQNFTNCASNDSDGDGATDTPSASTMTGPTSVWSDGTLLVVGDTSNRRVLIWNTFPTANGQPADVVVGQADFVTNTANTGGISASTMTRAYAFSNGEQLFVGDQDNNRVLIWDTIPTVNGAPADVVLGQANFTSNLPGTTVNTLNCVTGAHPAGNRLFVADSCNNRVLIFQGN